MHGKSFHPSCNDIGDHKYVFISHGSSQVGSHQIFCYGFSSSTGRSAALVVRWAALHWLAPEAKITACHMPLDVKSHSCPYEVFANVPQCLFDSRICWQGRVVEVPDNSLTQYPRNEKQQTRWFSEQYRKPRPSRWWIWKKLSCSSVLPNVWSYTEKNSWSNFTQLCRLNLGHKDIWTSIKS